MPRNQLPKVWIHCATQPMVEVSGALSSRFDSLGFDYELLMTGAADLVAPDHAALVQLPPDSPVNTRKFLEAEDPTLLLWMGGNLRPALMNGIAKAKIPAILVGFAEADLSTRRIPWPGRGALGVLQPFSGIYVTDGATATRLARIGFPEDKVTITGPILPDITAPGCDMNEMTVQAEAVGSRPVWFAMGARPGEIGQLADAHKSASTRGHRLLMLIQPRDLATGPEFARRLVARGMRCGIRSNGDQISEEMQAYILDEPGETGLWLRLSPLTFIGGTLSGPEGASPFLPAALGSVVLTGPFQKPFMDHYDRLSRAEACKRVRSGQELGIALGELIAPDRSAKMAHSAWVELTRSSDLLNTLADKIADASMGGGFA